MTNLLLFLSIIGTQIPGAVNSAPHYFPPGLFSTDPADDKGAAHVVSSFLERMGEMPLSLLPENVEAYRVTWLRPFDPVVVVRITHRQDEQDAIAEVRELPLGSNQEVSKAGQSYLAPHEWSALKEAIVDAGFWNSLTNTPTEPDVVAIDTSQWLIEGMRCGRYKGVQRTPPDVTGDKGFINLAITILEAGGIDVSQLTDE